MQYDDVYFMREALKEAHKAFEKDEVPVGTVIVHNNSIIARGHNLTEQLTDVTAHAEMQAITAAANYIGGKYLLECKIYITLEPCMMCAGALFWSQIPHMVYGASDVKNGYTQHNPNLFNPKISITKGILEDECASILKLFFKSKRS